MIFFFKAIYFWTSVLKLETVRIIVSLVWDLILKKVYWQIFFQVSMSIMVDRRNGVEAGGKLGLFLIKYCFTLLRNLLTSWQSSPGHSLGEHSALPSWQAHALHPSSQLSSACGNTNSVWRNIKITGRTETKSLRGSKAKGQWSCLNKKSVDNFTNLCSDLRTPSNFDSVFLGSK